MLQARSPDHSPTQAQDALAKIGQQAGNKNKNQIKCLKASTASILLVLLKADKN
jgi:hypothetical protein